MKQIEKLHRKLKKILGGRKIKDDRLNKEEFSSYELEVIEFFIQTKWQGYNIPTIIPISEKYYLDFIRWDNDQYKYVLISEVRKVKPWRY